MKIHLRLQALIRFKETQLLDFNEHNIHPPEIWIWYCGLQDSPFAVSRDLIVACLTKKKKNL